MAIDMEFLKSRGCSSGAYKKIATEDPAKWPPKFRRLINQVSARIRDGRMLNLKQWQAYAAIDKAYEVPFNQTTPTLVNHILNQHLDEEHTLEALEEWGLNKEELFMSVKDKKGNEIGILPNPPVFFKVIPTLVKAYTTAIVAKLYNARNTPPILDYRPRMQTDQNMVEASIITNLADGISQKMGYGAQLRSMIDQMCRYGLMLAFPREEWYWEWQRTFGGPKNRAGEDTGKKQTIREGLRYIIPDPTRFYYDLKYPLTSLNTNSGTEFIGHWHVLSYGQILDNKEWWNRSHIFAGTNWFKYPGSKYFWQEVYPCKMDISWGQEPGEMKREDKAGWYSTADRDKSIFVAEHFEKLVPRDWGLGDYDGPVWHRFTMAGDDTPIWIEPSAITPGIFMGYDYSENNDRTSSLSLEILPWQDWLGNILSQILLTAKQNLLKVIFYDKNQIDPDQIKEMRNIGEQMYRGMQFIPFDPLTNRIAQQNAQQAFFPVQLGTASINELIQVLPVFLSIMERVLQISAQMAGGAGPHQQGSKEIAQLGQSGQSRLDFIGAAIDEGIDAWETQLFDAAVNYADTDFVAQVDTDTPNLEHVIEEMGFTIRHKGKEKTMIAGSWKKLQLRDFARVGEGQTKETDRDAGQAIANVVAAVAAQKDLHEKIGATNLLQLLEYAARLMGAPKSFKLRETTEKKKEGVDEGTQEAIQAAIKSVMQAVDQKVAQPVAKEMQQAQGEITQMQQQLQQLQKLAQLAQQLVDKQNLKAKESQTKEQIAQQEAQAEEARKNTAFQAEEQRKNEQSQARIQRENAAAAAELELRKAQEARTETEHQAGIARGHVETSAALARKQAETEAKVDAAKTIASAKADMAKTPESA